jgi:hypothetical protein
VAKSNSAKGNYYKLRTKKWLEAKGYSVAFMERMMWIPPRNPGDTMIPIKKDQFGSDLLAVNQDEIIFVQVKFNRGGISVGRREFARYVFPSFAQRWIVIWEPRAREPEIEDCSGETQQLQATLTSGTSPRSSKTPAKDVGF